MKSAGAKIITIVQIDSSSSENNLVFHMTLALSKRQQ